MTLRCFVSMAEERAEVLALLALAPPGAARGAAMALVHAARGREGGRALATFQAARRALGHVIVGRP